MTTEIADVQLKRGDLAAALDLYGQALGMGPDRARAAEIKSRLGITHIDAGHEQGLEYLEAAERELDPATQARDLALTIAYLGRYHHLHARHRLSIELVQRAQAMLEPLDDPSANSLVYTLLTGAFEHMAESEASDRAARQLIELGEAHNLMSSVAVGLEYLAENAFGRGWWRETVQYAEKERRLAEAAGLVSRNAWALYAKMIGLWGQGQLRQAVAAGVEASKIAERTGDERLLALIYSYSGRIFSDLGDDAQSRGFVTRALELGERLAGASARVESQNALGYFHLQRGEWKEALAPLEASRRLLQDTDSRWLLLMTQRLLIQVYWGLRRDDAFEVAVQHEAEAAARGFVFNLATAMRVQGEILAATGNREGAEQRLEEALQLFGKWSAQTELGRTLYSRGEIRWAHGEHAQARADWAAARDIFAQEGAARDLAAVNLALNWKE